MDIDHTGDLAQLRALLSSPRTDDPWPAIVARLGGDPVAVLGELVPRAVIDPTDPEAPRPDPAAVARLDNAVRVVITLAADPAAALTATDLDDLHFLAHIAGRPAIAIRNGSYITPPPQWQFLNRERIESRLASVGRIDAPAGNQVGTGFVVNAGAVMTNRHVYTALLDRGGRALPADAVIDFGREQDGGSRTARIVAKYWVSTETNIDLALLQIDGDAPPPLRVQTTPPNPLEDHLLYAVGYPGADNDSDTPPDVLAAIFRGTLGQKRLQPGLLRGLDSDDDRRLEHDCSTLGGSSGSAVFDYATGLVCGLHFRGRYRRRNLAVALWTLARNQSVARHLTPG
jgi:glutamyl endopeptidase